MTDFCKYSDELSCKYLSNAEGSSLTIWLSTNMEKVQWGLTRWQDLPQNNYHRSISFTHTLSLVIHNYQKDNQTTDNLNHSCSFTVKLNVVVMKCLKKKKKKKTTRVIVITVALRWFFLWFKYSFTHNSFYVHAGMNKASMWSFGVWRTVLIIQLIKLVIWWSSRNKSMDSHIRV